MGGYSTDLGLGAKDLTCIISMQGGCEDELVSSWTCGRAAAGLLFVRGWTIPLPFLCGAPDFEAFSWLAAFFITVVNEIMGARISSVAW